MSLLQQRVGDFTVKGYQKGELRTVTREEIRDKWSLFFFYPADFSYLCSTEMQDLADIYEKFQETGCEVYTVSSDTHYVHQAWQQAEGGIGEVPYTMLADPAHVLSREFQVFNEANGLAERGAFIVNPDGHIVAYMVNAGNVGRNASELLRTLQASQFVYKYGNEVCPARWQPGEA